MSNKQKKLARKRAHQRELAARQRKVGRSSTPASRPDERALSLSRGRQAANDLDGFAALRWGLGKVAADLGLYGGIPMPLTGERLVVEPTFHKAAELSKIGVPEPKPADVEAAAEYKDWKIVNEWHSLRLRSRVYVMRDDKGRARFGKMPAFHHIEYDMSTLSCSDAWGLEQEHRAMQLLGEMIRHRQMKQYVLTGMFLERSERSGVTYIFRRLKPTVAIAPARDEGDGVNMRILACLCMHPIAYYAGSWAGGMCPTDDVMAHLALMRGDEHMFWKRSSQHPPHRPEAGL